MSNGEKIDFDLRPLNSDDAEELFKLTIKNRHHIKKFLNWMKDDYAIDDTIKFLSDSLEKEAGGKMFLRAIILDNKIIGLIDLHGISKDKNAEIGYWIDKDEQGKGIVTNATKQITEEGFQKLDLNRIGVRCAVENTKSCAIPQRLGYTKEGLLRQAALLEGKFHDMEIWSILKEEWKND